MFFLAGGFEPGAVRDGRPPRPRKVWVTPRGASGETGLIVRGRFVFFSAVQGIDLQLAAMTRRSVFWSLIGLLPRGPAPSQ